LLLWIAQGLWTLARPFERLRPVVVVAVAATFSLVFSVISVDKRLGPYRTNSMEFFRYDTLQDMDEAITAAVPLIAAADVSGAVVASLRAGTTFQFYRKGRLPQALYCQIACPDWDTYAAGWLGKVRDRAWLFLTDEEEKWMGPFVVKLGFSHEERVAVRGVRVWELVRTADAPGEGSMNEDRSAMRIGDEEVP